MGHQRDYSEHVAAVVDEEVKRLIQAAHDEAWDILNDNRDLLDQLVLALLEKETLDKAEVAEIFGTIRRRPSRPAWVGASDRVPPNRPPVMTPKELAHSNGHGRDREHSMGLPQPTDVPGSRPAPGSTGPLPPTPAQDGPEG